MDPFESMQLLELAADMTADLVRDYALQPTPSGDLVLVYLPTGHEIVGYQLTSFSATNPLSMADVFTDLTRHNLTEVLGQPLPDIHNPN